MIRVLEPISVPNESRDSCILINSTLFPFRGRLFVSIGFCCVIHLIGHIFIMQMYSFKFGY